MKTLVSTYTFSPTTKQVTLSGYQTILLEGLLLITNVTTNTIIYNFANPILGGTVSGNVVTLDYNTNTMSATDRLQIYYDDPANMAASDASLAALQEQNLLNRRMLKVMESLSVVDTNQRQRITVSAIEGANMNNSNPLYVRILDANSQAMFAPLGNGYVTVNTPTFTVPDIWKYHESSRLNYQQCIRNNLQFS